MKRVLLILLAGKDVAFPALRKMTMKSFILAILCTTGLLRGSAWCREVDPEWHVSPDPGPAGDGSIARPFRSLLEARDALRAIRGAGNGKSAATAITLEPGNYRLDATMEFGPNDGGTTAAPLVIRARKPGSVSLHGAHILERNAFRPLLISELPDRLAKDARKKILVCDLSARLPGSITPFPPAYRGVPPGPWLFANGERMPLARWPNQDAPGGGWAEFFKVIDSGLANANAVDPANQVPHPGTFVFGDPRAARWQIDQGVWLWGYWTHDWYDEVIQIGSYDAASSALTLAAPHTYGLAAGTFGAKTRRFFALNVLEELDAPGEWFLDRQQKLLYFYPPDPLDTESIRLATLTGPMILFKGTKFLRMEGIRFEYSHGDGVVLRETEALELAGCVFSNLSGSGIQVKGRNNIIRSCDLSGLGISGISLDGGDRLSLARADNLAENNHIHHYAVFQRTYAPGIAANGCGQVARRNRIHGAPHSAVLYGGNEHLFEGNEIYRVVMETGDAGAIYTGRDWTSQGNVLRHNFIHDLGGGQAGLVNTMGVYLDDCDSGDTVEGNLFLRAGRAIMIGGGRDNTITGNLVVDCPIGLHLDARGMTWKQWNNPAEASWHLEGKAEKMNYTRPPWSDRYPRLARIMHEEPRQPLGNVLRGNVFLDCSCKVFDADANAGKLLGKLEVSGNLVIHSQGGKRDALPAGLQGFRELSGTPEAPAGLAFRKLANREVVRPDAFLETREMTSFQPIPVDKIGLYPDPYRTRLPEY